MPVPTAVAATAGVDENMVKRRNVEDRVQRGGGKTKFQNHTFTFPVSPEAFARSHMSFNVLYVFAIKLVRPLRTYIWSIHHLRFHM